MRANKFGVQSEKAKKTQRAERFGIAAGAETSSDNKLEKRAQRFGVTADEKAAAVEGASTASPVSAEQLEKRAKRFGVAAANKESDDVLSKRKERFGIVDEDSKKKLRSQRFEAKV